MILKAHKCACPHCATWIPLKFLACGKHWKQLPQELRSGILATYKPGQEENLGKIELGYVYALEKCREYWRKYGQ